MSMKLRCGEFVGLAYASDDELREFAEEILADNVKLRKIARAHAATLEGCGCDYCPHERDCDPETVPMRDGCRVRDELRELGVDA